MQKIAPSPSRLAVMVLFAASCAGFALWLWLSFGGHTPLQPKRYRIQVAFTKAFQLPEQAPVREAGVPVGRVVDLGVTKDGRRTLATLEIEAEYAPLRSDARAILRTKSVGGETYVSISRGTPGKPVLRDGARLADDHVEEVQTVEDVFQIFDKRTRAKFRTWQQSLGQAVDGRGSDLSDAFGTLPALMTDAGDALSVLDRERAPLAGLIRGSGAVFDALSADSAALRTTITSFDTTFSALASQDDALARTFKTFPSFLVESRRTLNDLSGFAVDADPLVVQLKPALEQLPPTLRQARLLAPDLRVLMQRLGAVYTIARKGLPATTRTLRGVRPLMGSVGPFLEQLNPILQWLELNQTVVTDFFTEGITALGATSPAPGTPESAGHYLRQLDPGGAEALAMNMTRLPGNRGNAYPNMLDLGPIWQIKEIPPSFDCRNTGGAHPADATSPPCHEVTNRTLDGKKQGRFPHVEAGNYSGKR
jgi:phospholipid/cholesterol/gamma-HCH transport system substrate-binding protein